MHKSRTGIIPGTLAALAMMAGLAAAQYQPIPNFTGIGAGFDFRQAINQRLSGAQSIAPRIVGLAFTNLPAESDGLLLWCKNCQATTPCSGGGAGAWAMGARGAWACAAGALEQDLNANGHNIVAASSVKADLPGDAQYRELLVPGGGIKVGNGASAPFTVIDEGANLSGNVNGALNVKAPPYLAKGDGVTDDTAAIQAAVHAACANPAYSGEQEVYLPATPNSTYYKITSPILLNCSGIKFSGAGWSQTQIRQNYFGPTIIAQMAETGWKPPLTTSIIQTWQASHHYYPYYDIVDSNGNIEVNEASAAPCTTGSGSHPAWPTTQPNTTSDGTCTWALATVGGIPTIATGSGGSLDAADAEFFNGAGYGANNATTEIMNAANLEMFLNGLGAFTVEFYYEPFFSDGGNFDNLQLIGIHGGNPANNTAALTFVTNGNGCTLGYNCLRASAYIGGSAVNIGGSSLTGLSVNKIHHVALTYDGSTLRLFIDGAVVASSAASGTWTVPAFESFMIADNSPQDYLGQNAGVGQVFQSFMDSLRISNIARYTSNFTPPTAKFASDGNTRFLLNFPTGTPTGTMEGLVGNSTNAFIPIETSNGAADLNPAYIGNIGLSDNGIWATWMLNSTIENITFPLGAGRTCINFWNNNFQDTARRVFCSITPGSQTSVGFLFLNASNNNLYEHIQCDGQYACIGEVSGSGQYIEPDYTDRGNVQYPMYFINAQAQIDSPWFDIEDSAPNQAAGIYSKNALGPIVVNGGQIISGNASGAYLAIRGGKPILVNGAQFSGSMAEMLNVIANPSSPVMIHDATVPNGITLTNSGGSWWLNETLGGQDLGMKFADLPTSVTNGARRYCVDCDPPANPPVACTSAGAKTGAWIHGLNNSWICVP